MLKSCLLPVLTSLAEQDAVASLGWGKGMQTLGGGPSWMIWLVDKRRTDRNLAWTLLDSLPQPCYYKTPLPNPFL